MIISNVTCTQIVPTLRFRAIVEHLVNPELKEEFQQDKCNWIPRTDTPEHKELPVLSKKNGQGNESSGHVVKPTVVLEAMINLVVKG